MSDEEAPEVTAVLAELANAPVGERTEMDRYRDFRRVFLGSNEGRRVLHDLLNKCGINRTSLPPGQVDPMRVAFKEGNREVGLWLMGTLTREPAQRPDRTNRTKGET